MEENAIYHNLVSLLGFESQSSVEQLGQCFLVRTTVQVRQRARFYSLVSYFVQQKDCETRVF